MRTSKWSVPWRRENQQPGFDGDSFFPTLPTLLIFSTLFHVLFYHSFIKFIDVIICSWSELWSRALESKFFQSFPSEGVHHHHWTNKTVAMLGFFDSSWLISEGIFDILPNIYIYVYIYVYVYIGDYHDLWKIRSPIVVLVKSPVAFPLDLLCNQPMVNFFRPQFCCWVSMCFFGTLKQCVVDLIQILLLKTYIINPFFKTCFRDWLTLDRFFKVP